jgi:tRNA dimethylallyltransferase
MPEFMAQYLYFYKYMKKIIIITGPTATGKSELAFNLANLIETDIISADSRQIYKYLDIGTAKPLKKTLEKVKHHLLNIITPDMKYSAGTFVEDAEKIIDSNEQPLIVCGGTGFYIRALTDWSLNLPYDESVKNKVEEECEAVGIEEMYNKLQKLDAEEAEKIEPNNKLRILRMLEIIYITNKKVSELKNGFVKNKYNYLKICVMPPRNEIYNNINCRVDKMISDGLIEETNNILGLGFTDNCPGLNTIGYKEIINYLNNKYSLDEAIYKIKLNTRHYAKRQITWFKKEPNLKYFENNFESIKKACLNFLYQ